MVAGIVDHETGTRDIRKLGGLATLMPITATLAIFGTFSMAGVPFPFLNGYYSKELFFGSTLGLGSDFWSQAIRDQASICYFYSRLFCLRP